MRRLLRIVPGILVLALIVLACQDEIANSSPNEITQIQQPPAAEASGDYQLHQLPGLGSVPPISGQTWLSGDFVGPVLTTTEADGFVSMTPDFYSQVVAAGGSVDEPKHIIIRQGLLPPKAEILFSFDLTGSMGGALDNIRGNSGAIINAVNLVMPESEFGVVYHHDYPGYAPCYQGEACDYPGWGWNVYGDPGSIDPAGCAAAYDAGASFEELQEACVCDYIVPETGFPLPGPCLPTPDIPYQLVQSLTPNPEELNAALTGLPIGGGRDNPENYSRVMYEAYMDEGIGWSNADDVGKFLIMWVDHPPHDCDLTLGGDCFPEGGVNYPFPSTGPDPGSPEGGPIALRDALQGLRDHDITLITLFVGFRDGDWSWDTRKSYIPAWECYANLAGGRSFVIEGDGTFPSGGEDPLDPTGVAEYMVDAMEGGFGNLDLTFGSPTPGFEGWVTGPDPIPIDLNNGDFDDEVNLTFSVPLGTLPGIYSFEACAYGNGVILACQDVRITVSPQEGHVTGGGWIDSPSGAYMPDLNLTGRATFGFVSRYKKGATIPDGSTEFQFHAAGLNFHSDSYDWLVVNQNGANAQFKGSGTVNGMGEYRFMIWAGDGTPDTFRIKIWQESEGGWEDVLYDNGVEQEIGGGSIVIHVK